MSIFDLHSAVLADYRDFIRSFFSVADDRARCDQELRTELQAHGYRVIVIRYDQSVEAQLTQYPEIFGRERLAQPV